MSTHPSWQALIGDWSGTNRLILPDVPDHVSPGTATGSWFAKQTMCAVTYTWVIDGETQEGQLLLSRVDDAGAVEAVFLDTWHYGSKFMHMTGHIAQGDKTLVNGHYAAPEGPDWGWRIEIDPHHADGWQLQMFNVTPDGESFLGVEMNMQRA